MFTLRRKAFTIIELIVVIAVLGILILIALPKFVGHTEEARVKHIQHDVKIAEDILSDFLIDNELPEEWPDVSINKLNALASDSKLYDVSGYTEKVINGSYVEVDKELLRKKMRTHLGGKFYVNTDETKLKVYYGEDEHSNVEYKDGLFDREVDEVDIDQDKINVLSYIFPNGIYRNGEIILGNVEVEGIQAGDYFIEFQYIHSKFNTKLTDTVEFNLEQGQTKVVNFDFLVEPSHTRGFYDFALIIRDSEDNKLVDYYVSQTVYFAESEWVYYYEDDFNEIDRPIIGQIGALSSNRVSYDYTHESSTGIDYSSFTFDVQPNSNESGQIRSIIPVTYGTYEAMIKIPDSDALLNGFFLYGHNENNHGVEHEIDIEILYYEGKWQVWGTIFNETHEDYVYNGIEHGVIYQTKLDLNFDPTENHHSYRIDFYDDFISFAVDGEEFGRWENQFDYGDMHLYAGNFYTHWLTGELSDKSLEMDVKWIRKGYFK